MYTIDIENALRNGKTLESIMAEMHDAAMSAAATVKAEKDGVKQCREDFMVAMISYLDAIGVLNVDEVSEEDTEKLEDMLIQLEDELGKITTLIDAVTAGYESNKRLCDDCNDECESCPHINEDEKGSDEDTFLNAILAKLV